MVLSTKVDIFGLTLCFMVVQKITISDSLTADGLQLRFPNGTRQLVQLAEGGTIVLTAGAINTPKILMQSGIGDGDVLNKLGIPVKKHLPRVGMNLQDHPVLGVTYEAVAPHSYDVKEELEMYFNATKMRQTNASSFGLMGSAGLSAGAFLIPPGSTIPEIQLTMFPRKSEPHMTNSSSLQHSTEVLITVALVNPHARNRVILVKREHDGELIPYIEAEVPVNETEHLQHVDVWKLAWGVSVVREICADLGETLVLRHDSVATRD
jgi:choline dehydrogenase